VIKLSVGVKFPVVDVQCGKKQAGRISTGKVKRHRMNGLVLAKFNVELEDGKAPGPHVREGIKNSLRKAESGIKPVQVPERGGERCDELSDAMYHEAFATWFGGTHDGGAPFLRMKRVLHRIKKGGVIDEVDEVHRVFACAWNNRKRQNHGDGLTGRDAHRVDEFLSIAIRAGKDARAGHLRDNGASTGPREATHDREYAEWHSVRKYR
jgi:hypothetical protein